MQCLLQVLSSRWTSSGLWHRRHLQVCYIFPGNRTGGWSAVCWDQLNYIDSVVTRACSPWCRDEIRRWNESRLRAWRPKHLTRHTFGASACGHQRKFLTQLSTEKSFWRRTTHNANLNHIDRPSDLSWRTDHTCTDRWCGWWTPAISAMLVTPCVRVYANFAVSCQQHEQWRVLDLVIVVIVVMRYSMRVTRHSLHIAIRWSQSGFVQTRL